MKIKQLAFFFAFFICGFTCTAQGLFSVNHYKTQTTKSPNSYTWNFVPFTGDNNKIVPPSANKTPMIPKPEYYGLKINLANISGGEIKDPTSEKMQVFGSIQVIPKNMFVLEGTNQFLYNKGADKFDELVVPKDIKKKVSYVSCSKEILLYFEKSEIGNASYDIIFSLFEYNPVTSSSTPFQIPSIQKSFRNINLTDPATLAGLQIPLKVKGTTANGESIIILMQTTLIK